MGPIQIEGEVIAIADNDPSTAHYIIQHGTRREFIAAQPKFLAFNVRNGAGTTWTQQMTWLDAQGFDTVLNYVNDDYPKDGIVYRIDNRAAEAAADIGMFALKF
jgi:hypothetical protein